MATDILTTTLDEGAGGVVTIGSFTDQNGDTVSVDNITAVTWTLSDAHGNIINGRENEALTPAASIEVGLVAAETTAASGDDVSNGYFYRYMLVKYTYDTTINGNAVNDYPGTKEVAIKINSYINVK